MKIKIISVLVLICFLLFAGCTEEVKDDATNDDGNNDNGNNDNGDTTVTAGWYLKETVDYDDPGENSQYGITYSRGEVTTNHYSADGNYELTVKTTWSSPPEYIAEEGDISIDVTKEAIVLELLLLGYVDESYVKIDDSTIEPGFATASRYFLIDATYGDTLGVGQGDTPDTVKTATFTGKAPKSDGPFDGEFGLTFGISNGPSYGTKYIYEWRE